MAELDAEAARIEAVRGLIPAFESKIQRVLARVWGTAVHDGTQVKSDYVLHDKDVVELHM